MIKLVNFSHPLTNEVLHDLEETINDEVDVVNVAANVNLENDLSPQIASIIESIPLSPDQWQAGVLVNMPGLAPASVVILTMLHGRMGHFPSIIRLAPVKGAIPAKFSFVEIVNLQEVRNQARTARF